MLIACIALALAAAPANREDLLELANGAMVLAGPSEQNERTNSVTAVIDGTPAVAWRSGTGAKPPFTFVLELARESAITQVAVDDSGAKNAGSTARDVEWLASPRSSTEGFASIAR